MKAKFVYESISFERGQEPKDVMGLGNTPDTFMASGIDPKHGEIYMWIDKGDERAHSGVSFDTMDEEYSYDTVREVQEWIERSKEIDSNPDEYDMYGNRK